MHATLPLLQVTSFPAIRRRGLETLQVNVGYRCNQSCVHCHVNAGPTRKEMMGREVADEVLAFLRASRVATLDITGGNSGSAALNSKAELIGLAFDGTLDSIISDWDFNKAMTRDIQVDIRYILWNMQHVDKADNLLKEMNAL